jgi:phosphonate transport system substrate-binding protein
MRSFARNILLIFSLLFYIPVASASSASFMVFEGVASQASFLDTETKYKPLAAIADTASGGKNKFQIIISQNFKDLRARLNTNDTAFDVALVRPSNVSAQMIKTFGYQPLVVSDAPTGVAFVVKKNSSITALKDSIREKFFLPDAEGAMSKLAFFEMKQAGLKKEALNIEHTRLQDVVLYSLEAGIADVGAVNFQQAAQFEAKGGKVIHRGKPVPGMVLLVSKKIDPAAATRLREAFLALDKTDSGKELLKQIGVKKFVTASPEPFIEVLERTTPAK